MHCLCWESHCLSLQAVPLKSHCSLFLETNTVYLAFRYPLMSISLNLSCPTIYSLFYGFIQCLFCVNFTSVYLTSLPSTHFNVPCSSPTYLAWEHFNVHCNCSVLLDPVFSFNASIILCLLQ